MSYNTRYKSNQFTPAQNAVLNPARLVSEKATVISVSKAGLYRNAMGISMYKLTVETSEQPGQPLELWGQASLAQPLSTLAVDSVISFEGTVQGGLGFGKRPHVVVNTFNVL